MAKLAHTVTIVYEKGDEYAVPDFYSLVMTLQESQHEVVEVIESPHGQHIIHIKEKTDG